MKLKNRIAAGTLLASCLLAGAAFAASVPENPVPDRISETLGGGKVSLNVRTRYEGVEQSGLKDADAITVRTRLGFTTAAVGGFKAAFEAENIASPNGDRYSQAGLNPGGTGRAVVADPTGTDLNQVWLSYTAAGTTLTAGRQRLVLDNARFVGDVGWRQNMQTFDGITVVSRAVEHLTLSYAWLEQINRVFGDRHAQGRWKSNSHLLNAGYAIPSVGTLTGYGYLLDFENAAANSSATWGASLAGSVPAGAVTLPYRFEFAQQSDYRSNPASYSTDYRLAEFGAGTKGYVLAAGYEALGSDSGVSFKTPLATLHAFNGWADLFLATPAAGLRDTYGKAVAPLPLGFGLLAFYHSFETDAGASLGSEWDLQLSRKFGKYFTGTAKYADFSHDTNSLADVSKLWLQVDFAY